MSNPSDEKPQRIAGTEEEQLSGKIEKVTESLLSQWEISEDDFEDTQDLTETAAHISRQIAPGASNRNAAGSIRREEAEPRSQATPHSQTVSRSQTTPHSQSEPAARQLPTVSRNPAARQLPEAKQRFPAVTQEKNEAERKAVAGRKAVIGRKADGRRQREPEKEKSLLTARR